MHASEPRPSIRVSRGRSGQFRTHCLCTALLPYLHCKVVAKLARRSCILDRHTFALMKMCSVLAAALLYPDGCTIVPPSLASRLEDDRTPRAARFDSTVSGFSTRIYRDGLIRLYL